MSPRYVLGVDIALALDRETHALVGDVAHATALASLSWEVVLEAGDASARAGNQPDARHAYLVAFHRARGVESVEGTLRVAGALAALGEPEAVDQMVRVAERIAGRRATQPGEIARVREEGAALVARASVARQARENVQ